MKVSEPVTALTDYALAILSAVLGVLLFRAGHLRGQLSEQLWAGAFFAVAAAALTGGTFHGLAAVVSHAVTSGLRRVTVCSAGLASFFFLTASIVASVASPLRQWLLGAAILQLALSTAWVATGRAMRFVVYNAVAAMVGVVALQAAAAVYGDQKAVWIIAGTLVSMAGGGVQRSGFTLHEHFNRNDLYHVVQMGAMWLLYEGGRLLSDLT